MIVLKGNIDMKIDMHAHSKYSKRPAQWALQKIGAPESFTDPGSLYRTMLKRGMSAVTITDHNSIDGCLEIAHLPSCFISEEVTTYFPEDGCKTHLLAYNIDEKIHAEIQKLRENIYDLVKYLYQERIVYAIAHPLYSVNHKLTVSHFEKLLLLSRNFESNGARSHVQNQVLDLVLKALNRKTMEEMADQHSIEPLHDTPWKKHLIGGSDDHSAMTLAMMYTEVTPAKNYEEFLLGVEYGKAKPGGGSSTPRTLAHNLYSIAYQFYKDKLKLEKHLRSDLVLSFLNRCLDSGHKSQPGLRARFNSYISHRRAKRNGSNRGDKVLDLLRNETYQLIRTDQSLERLMRKNGNSGEGLAEQWYDFSKKVTDKLSGQFADNIMESVSGANFLNVFQSIGSAVALYGLIAPYLISYNLFSEGRELSLSALTRFNLKGTRNCPMPGHKKMAHFTDTFYEINGVALTLKKHLEFSTKYGHDYKVLTCWDSRDKSPEGVKNFKPLRMYELEVYPEQKIFFPPFLDMLDYCYSGRFTHLHSATPGPVGLAALAIARTLGLPILGTYHTALPQYTEYLTNDTSLADLMWRYVIWYYDQMDMVLAPSASTKEELVKRGLKPDKVRVFPRGVDTEFFNPAKRNRFFGGPVSGSSVRLLYVGRVSKEKNLEQLTRVFKALCSNLDNVELVVVGDGPYLNEMRENLAPWPASFPGYLQGEDLARAFASSDIFVFPSATDTFGNVVLEAQASGLPVIVSDKGGPGENLDHGATGLIFKAYDDESLMNAIKRLVFNDELRALMGKNARIYAESRSNEKAYQKTWEMYTGQIPPLQTPPPSEVLSVILSKAAS